MRQATALFISLSIIASCGSPSNNSNNAEETEIEEIAEAAEEAVAEEVTQLYSEVIYREDSLTSGYLLKQTLSYQSFEPDGTTSLYEYSIENPTGKTTTDRSALWVLTIYDEARKAYSVKGDTTILLPSEDDVQSAYVYQNGKLTYFSDFLYQVEVRPDAEGNPIDIKVGIKDERNLDKFSWYFIQRDYKQNLSQPSNYLELNGKDPLEKERKSIIDYYVLMTRAGLFQPEHTGGMFDVSNGYFEIMDEGTGAGQYTSQLVLFRKNDGKEIIALASRGAEPVRYMVVSSYQPPKFYTFTGSKFEEVLDIFPQISDDVFLPEGVSNEEVNFETYYVLPRKGLAITYNLNHAPIIDYCENQLAKSKDNMSEEDFFWENEKCKIYQKITKTEIKLPFNKETGKFEMSE